jgi:type II secretory pathway pseudopilin PulG
MLVVLIISLLGGLAVPAVAPSMSQNSFRKAAESVREAFEFARAQAIASGLSHRIHIELESGGQPGSIQIYQGLQATCQFEFGEEDLLVRQVDFAAPGSEPVDEVDAENVRRIRIETQASIAGVQPDAVLVNDLCVRPDGSVRDARLNLPLSSTNPAGGAGTGMAVVEVRDNTVSSAGAYSVRGAPLRVVIPYSGVARVAF